jgi:streptomycin 6-kinase
MAGNRATDVQDRRNELAREWRVTIDHSFETATSHIAYGRRDAQPVVLKIVKCPGDEWWSGQGLTAFDGRGVVRVYEHVGGALLLERLDPGDSLVELTLSGRDEEATAILADVIGSMSPHRPLTACPAVQDWAGSFKRYVASGDDQVPMNLVSQAGRLYTDLCESQRNPRLLHGDLQHYNVLFDRHRGWLAIDPKGVVGEIEYEIGAALRNPCERPDLFVDPAIIERRLGQFASKLNLDPARALAWSFAQAVLSAIWEVEDGSPVDARNPSILLAIAIRPMLERAV